MMPAPWQRFFRSWAQREEYAARVAAARETIAQALITARQPYVAFSGGKDSTVLTHLVLQQAPDIMVLHWDYGPAFVPRPLQRQILEHVRRLGARNLRVETAREYWRVGRQARNVWYRHFFGRLAPQLMAEGYDLVFVGLRREESVRRRLRIAAGRSLTSISECWPLADWSWRDVWAYIVTQELPYLALYDERAALLGYEQVRFSTLFDPEFTDLGNDTIDNVLHWRWRHS